MKSILSPVLAGVSLLVVGAIIVNSIINGEQLVIKFLVTIVVAALGLYIISDLRLRRTENSAILANQSSSVDSTPQTESGPAKMPIIRSKIAETVMSPPSNSTAAFMADMNKTKERDLASSKDRSYSTMSRIDQKRRASSDTNKEKGAPPTANLRAKRSGTQAKDVTPPQEEEILVVETDLDAPLDTVRISSPIEELQPSEAGGLENAKAEVNEDLTSILSIPTDLETDEDNFDEAESLVYGDDLSEANVSDGSEKLRDGYSLVADSPEEDPGSNIDDDDPTVVGPPNDENPADETVEASTPERRRFAPEDIRIEDLRSVDFEKIGKPRQTVEQATNTTPTSKSSTSLSAVNSAIADGERSIISSLMDRGVLSVEGPITNEDVTTMIYVAFTSSELRSLLNKGGTIDGVNGEISLAGLGIYTTDDLEENDQFLVAGPDEAISQLKTQAGT